MDNKVMLEIKPTMESVPQVAAFIEEHMEQMEISLKLMMRLMVVLDEIYSNIVNYSGAKNACITMQRADTELILGFEDDGKPYNPLEAEEPDITASVEERTIGGLGVFMVKKMMDRVEYEYSDNKNRLALVKSLRE